MAVFGKPSSTGTRRHSEGPEYVRHLESDRAVCIGHPHGLRRPHKRHWQALAELAGVLPGVLDRRNATQLGQ